MADLPFGYIEGDGLLNSCGVCTGANRTETIQLMEGWKNKRDHARLNIVTTPDLHYLIGLSVAFGNGGWCYAPSISGVGYESRMEAIKAAVKSVLATSYIESKECKDIIKRNYNRLKTDGDQLLLF